MSLQKEEQRNREAINQQAMDCSSSQEKMTITSFLSLKWGGGGIIERGKEETCSNSREGEEGNYDKMSAVLWRPRSACAFITAEG